MDEEKYEQVLKELRSAAGKVRRKGREYEVSRVGWKSEGISATEQMPESWEPIGADVVERLLLGGHLKREDISGEGEI